MKRNFLIIAFLLVIVSLAIILIFIFPRYGDLLTDPQVRAAWEVCKPLAIEDQIECFERNAVQTQNPDICWLVGAAQDDWCMQSVYEMSKDKEICEQISKIGVRNLCEEHFEKVE